MTAAVSALASIVIFALAMVIAHAFDKIDALETRVRALERRP